MFLPTKRRISVAGAALALSISSAGLASSATRYTHPWGFSIEVPDGWNQLSDGGVAVDPVAFTSNDKSELTLHIHRLIRSGETTLDSAESIEAMRREWVEALGDHFPGLTGVQVQVTEHQSRPTVDMLAAMESDVGFRHVRIRAVITKKATYLLTVSAPQRAMNRVAPAMETLLASLNIEPEFPLPGHFQSSFAIGSTLMLLLGMCWVVFRRTDSHYRSSTNFLTLGLMTVIALLFIASHTRLADRQEQRRLALHELGTLERDHPGISQETYEPRAIRQHYASLRERFDPIRVEPLFAQWGLLPMTPRFAQLFTHLWLHANWTHLLSNLFFLWLCGRVVERAMGWRRMLACFLLGGVAGALLHVASFPESARALVGASGAVSALLGASLIVGFARPVGLSVPWLFDVSFRLPTGLVALAWIGAQLWQAFVWGEVDGFWVHSGGLAFGILFATAARLGTRHHT